MIFQETPLKGAFVIELDRKADDRGFFARGFCAKEMQDHDLASNVVQANISFNEHKGTLRGMHYQTAPHEEEKTIRCVRGAVFDVIVDLREDSDTYLQWYGTELTDDNRRALFVPAGFAHGYQTLEPGSEVLYLVSNYYAPQAGRGVLYRDPAIGIDWPLPAVEVSAQDESWPCLSK